jgi:hypothetical protein
MTHAEPPKWNGQFAGRGGWSIPYRVRYAASYDNEAPRLWGEWISGTQYSNPVFDDMPKSPEGKWVSIWRLFEGQVSPTRLIRYRVPPRTWVDFFTDVIVE